MMNWPRFSVLLFLALSLFGLLMPRPPFGDLVHGALGVVSSGSGIPPDKILHAVLFSMLSASFFVIGGMGTRSTLYLLLIIAAGTEFVQPFFGRQGEASDFLANCLGIGMGSGIVLISATLIHGPRLDALFGRIGRRLT